MNIKFLDSHTMSLNGDLDFSSLEKLGDYSGYSLTINDDILSFGQDAEIIITNKIKIDNNIIEKFPRLKLICVIATGYDVVDVKAANKKNIMVANVPQYAKYSVSQHTFTLILTLLTNICSYHKDVREGKWENSSSFALLKYPTFELANKTIGIIGFGAIGREVVKIAESFHMKVLVYDIFDISTYGYVNSSFDEIIENSDIISIHLPLNSKTKNLIAKKEFKKMKNSALIINTSRSGIINEDDLMWALNSDKIGGAGLDVLAKEPPMSGNPLLGDVKNLIITPHVAWSSREARQRLVNVTAENIKLFKEENPINIVNETYIL